MSKYESGPSCLPSSTWSSRATWTPYASSVRTMSHDSTFPSTDSSPFLSYPFPPVPDVLARPGPSRSSSTTTTPSSTALGARDVQRAFRARRAAHLAKLEDRILELEAENNRLRALMALPTVGRDDLGSGPTGRGKSLKEGGVPMAERVKAKKERDRLRAQQAARLKGILPPSNEEVDKAHGHELLGDLDSQTPDDSSSRRDLTRTPDSGAGSLRLGRSPSFGMLTTPGTNVSLVGTPHLGVGPGIGAQDHSAVSFSGLHHKMPFGSGDHTPGSNGPNQNLGTNNNNNNNQVQADLQRLYQQAILATQLSTTNGMQAQNNWGQGSPSIGMNQGGGPGGYSNLPSGHNLGNSSGSTPPANLPDLIALLTGITNQQSQQQQQIQQQQRSLSNGQQQHQNGFGGDHMGPPGGGPQQSGGLSNLSLPMPFPASNAPSFPSAPSTSNNGQGYGGGGQGYTNGGGPNNGGNNNNNNNSNSNNPNHNPFPNFSFNPPASAPPQFPNFNLHASPPAPHLPPHNQNNNPHHLQNMARGGPHMGLRTSSFGNPSGLGSRSPGDMRPPPPPGGENMPSRPHSSAGHNALGLDADKQRMRSESVGKTQQQHQQHPQQQQQPQAAADMSSHEEGERAEPDLLHRLRHCCHLTDHHVATDPGLLLFASRLCLAVGCPFTGNHSEIDDRPEDGGGKRRRMDFRGQDDESENPEGYMKLEAAWSALRSHLDPTSSDQNPLLGIPGLGGGERDGQNAIATGRLAAEMILRGARSKMQASSQGGPGGSQDPEAVQLAFWIGCRRRSGLVIERSLVEVITMTF